METRIPIDEALRQSEGRFRLLVESVQDYGIFMLDAEGRIASWNRGAERIKGYSEKDVLGQHFSIFYTKEARDRRHPQHELEVATAVGRFEEEGWRVRKDGSLFWANVVITALRDVDGSLVGFAKVTRDLTERKRAEAEREALLEAEREARREAEALTEEVQLQSNRLRKQTEELEAANRTKSEFLANMSHELRTPLNAIIGYSDLLATGVTGPVTEAQKAQLERVKISSQHLLMLIEDILDIAKVEAGRLEVALELGRISDPVAAALSLLEAQAAERGIAITNRCEPEPGVFYVGDADRVRQILVNLLANSLKFTKPDGEITIGCEVVASPDPGCQLAGAGPWLCVRVEDTGTGIRREDQESVFDPFVQVETGPTRSTGGAGLGLSISRRLARLMNGDLTLRSELGRGSCFTLWLPAGGRNTPG